jgi:hypothetical protein
MKRFKRTICLLGLTGLLGVPLQAVTAEELKPAAASVAAAPLQSSDIKAIQVAVQAQLDAFAQDDGDAAFGLSSTDTRSRFGSPDNFLRVVKKHYTPIYRHSRANFSAPEIIEGEVYQMVDLIDENSRVWIAVYRMERDDAGLWKIDGCQLHETGGISI